MRWWIWGLNSDLRWLEENGWWRGQDCLTHVRYMYLVSLSPRPTFASVAWPCAGWFFCNDCKQQLLTLSWHALVQLYTGLTCSQSARISDEMQIWRGSFEKSTITAICTLYPRCDIVYCIYCASKKKNSSIHVFHFFRIRIVDKFYHLIFWSVFIHFRHWFV